MRRIASALVAFALAGAAAAKASAEPVAFTTFDVPGAADGTAATGLSGAGQVTGCYGDATGRHGFV